MEIEIFVFFLGSVGFYIGGFVVNISPYNLGEFSVVVLV